MISFFPAACFPGEGGCFEPPSPGPPSVCLPSVLGSFSVRRPSGAQGFFPPLAPYEPPPRHRPPSGSSSETAVFFGDILVAAAHCCGQIPGRPPFWRARPGCLAKVPQTRGPRPPPPSPRLSSRRPRRGKKSSPPRQKSSSRKTSLTIKPLIIVLFLAGQVVKNNY